jgi:hypothetical protein
VTRIGVLNREAEQRNSMYCTEKELNHTLYSIYQKRMIAS